jgi:hypothetical protein
MKTESNIMLNGFGNSAFSLSDLTLFPIRVTLAKLLVIFSFVWPFFNYQLVASDSTVELNFLPVFLAALLLPEVMLHKAWPIAFALPIFGVAFIWASPSASLRLVIAIIPLHFVLNLTRHLQEHGQDLLMPNLAYRAFQVFAIFSIVQDVHFYLFPVIPECVTQALMAVVPRYSGIPYDDSGTRGVQGWASEPSGAALTCMAFSLVAIVQRPSRRWRILFIYILLLLVNKSVYAFIMTTLLGLVCLATLKRKVYSAFALVPMSVVVLFYIGTSNRFTELKNNLLVNGLSGDSNSELARFVQISSPILQFPRIYKPVTLIFEGVFMPMEPLGLFPLMVGYGSLLGLVWIICMIFRNYRSVPASQRPMALIAAFILLILAPPDLIPAVVAVAICLVPQMNADVASGAELDPKRFNGRFDYV